MDEVIRILAGSILLAASMTYDIVKNKPRKPTDKN